MRVSIGGGVVGSGKEEGEVERRRVFLNCWCWESPVFVIVFGGEEWGEGGICQHVGLSLRCDEVDYSRFGEMLRTCQMWRFASCR